MATKKTSVQKGQDLAAKEVVKVKKELVKAEKKCTDYIKKNPKKATGIAAAIGAAIGAAIAGTAVAKSKRKKK